MAETNIKLPKDWQILKLKDVCEITTGDKDVNEGKITGKYPFFTCAKENYSFDSYSFDGEAILIAGNGNFSVKHYKGKFEAYQRTYVLQNFSIDYKYLFYNLLGNLHIITKGNRGSTVRYIRIGDLTEYSLAIPPLHVQKKIVSKIEELFSELDHGINNLKMAQQQTKIYSQAVLKWAFEGRFTNKNYIKDELPKGWEYKKLHEISNVSGGLTKNAKRQDFELKLPFLRVANVYSNFLDLSEIHTIGIKENEIERVKLEKNDLLFVEGNGSIEQIGRTALWDGSIENCVHQNHLIKSRLFKHISPKYTLYFFCSKNGRDKIKQSANSTSGLHTLNISKISNLELPVCSINEQNEIIQEIESRLSIADKMNESITQSLQQAEALRQSILKKAFEGKLN